MNGGTKMWKGTQLKKVLLDSVPHVHTVFTQSLSSLYEPLDPVFMHGDEGLPLVKLERFE